MTQPLLLHRLDAPEGAWRCGRCGSGARPGNPGAVPNCPVCADGGECRPVTDREWGFALRDRLRYVETLPHQLELAAAARCAKDAHDLYEATVLDLECARRETETFRERLAWAQECLTELGGRVDAQHRANRRLFACVLLLSLLSLTSLGALLVEMAR